MPKFNFLVRLNKPTYKIIEDLVSTFENQTNSDWVLHLVYGHSDKHARFLVSFVTHPQVHFHSRPDLESISQTCNALVPALPTTDWVGLFDQQSQLSPNAVQLLSEHSTAVMIYSNMAHRNRHGFFSLLTAKGAVDYIRLRSQNYLDGLTMISKPWFNILGKFDARASDSPTHDLFLKTIEQGRIGDIAYIEEPILYVFRDHRKYFATDTRLKPFMPRYDLWAIREHYKRIGLNVSVAQQNGTVDTSFNHYYRWPVSVLVVAPESQHGTIRTELEAGTHKPTKIVCITSNEPSELNQGVRMLDTPLVAILQGMPADCNWLATMVDWMMLPGVGNVYGRTVHNTRLTFPGTIRAKFHDWDWNTRGEYYNLQIPRQISTAGHFNMITDLSNLLLHPFKEQLPTLAGMDYGLTLDSLGNDHIYLPQAVVMVDATIETDPAEVAEFELLHPNWKDRFGLYLSM